MGQEVTTQAWGRRLARDFLGLFAGIALIILSLVLIFWNEGKGNSIHVAESLKQTQKAVISIPNTPIEPQNNLHVVHITGKASTSDLLHDEILDIYEHAIKLDRQVEMYQWQENVETTKDKQQIYHYRQVWSDKLIDSTPFKEATEHKNPSKMPIQSQQQYAENIVVGDFHLPMALLDKMSGSVPVDLAKAGSPTLREKTKKIIHHDDTDLYLGNDPTSPKIGDIKITLTAIHPQTVSIIAQQTGDTLQPYMASGGQAVSLIVMGQKSPEQILNEASDMKPKWAICLLGIVALILATVLLLHQKKRWINNTA